MGSIDLVLFLFAMKKEVLMLETVEKDCNTHNTKIIAICNQKGGVAKTVTAVNLGVGLAREGKRVLLVDLDAQALLTVSCWQGIGSV